MSDVKVTSIAFERQYSDNSGVEYAVRLVNDRHGEAHIEFAHVGDPVLFPLGELGWLIGCLEKIKKEVMGDEWK